MNNMKRMATDIWWTHGRTIRSQVMFWIGIGFLINWIYNVSTGNAEDSWLIAAIFIYWGWEDHPKWKTFKKNWYFLWGRIRYRHVVKITSNELLGDFYPPVYEWIEKNLGTKNVWLEYNSVRVTLELKNNPIPLSTNQHTKFEFRFKRKKDAVAFKLVWG